MSFRVIGTGSGTVAAGNDSRIVNAIQNVQFNQFTSSVVYTSSFNQNTSSFVTTSSFNQFTSSVVTTSSLNQFTSSVVSTASFNAFTSSVEGLAGFNQFTSSVVTTSSFNQFTSSVVNTSSFNQFTSSVVNTSSFNQFTSSVLSTSSLNSYVTNSVVFSQSVIQLSGDVPTPVNNTFYGIVGGIRGWYSPATGSAIGDMTKSVYDTNNDGIVNAASSSISSSFSFELRPVSVVVSASYSASINDSVIILSGSSDVTISLPSVTNVPFNKIYNIKSILNPVANASVSSSASELIYENSESVSFSIPRLGSVMLQSSGLYWIAI